jgi:hypothetical protein
MRPEVRLQPDERERRPRRRSESGHQVDPEHHQEQDEGAVRANAGGVLATALWALGDTGRAMSDLRVRHREGSVYLCVGGSITRPTTSEVDEGRAAAERRAEERG